MAVPCTGRSELEFPSHFPAMALLMQDATLQRHRRDLRKRLEEILAAGAGAGGRAAAAQALRQVQGGPAGVRDGPRGAFHERRVGAGAAAERDIPQGDERDPFRVGRGMLRRGALGPVGSLGPCVREASQGADAGPGPGAGASPPLAPGPAGARAGDGRQRGNDRLPSRGSALGDSWPAPPPFLAERAAQQRAGAHVRRLAGSRAGLCRGRLGRALRRGHGRQLRVESGADRYRQRLDGLRGLAGARRAPGRRGRGAAPQRAPVPAARDRHGQRDRVPERRAGHLLQRAGD